MKTSLAKQLKKPFAQYNLVLLILLAFETAFLFYFNRKIPYQANSIAVFLCSVATGVAVLAKFYKKSTVYIAFSLGDAVRKDNKWIWYLTGFLAILAAYFSQSIFRAIPINVKQSDIIPAISVIVGRFLAGENPYQPITEFGYYVPVAYLPAHWLPYVFAALVGCDFRWVSFAIWLCGVCAAIWGIAGIQSARQKLIATILPFLIYFVICESNGAIFGVTVESMVAGYYMLLIVGLGQRNAVGQATFIAICMLSRYSLVLWLPLWFFVLLLSDRKALVSAMLVIALIVVGLYLIPFLSQDWESFYRGFKSYDTAALSEWSRLDAMGRPYHLVTGVGFAWYFYDHYASLEMLQRIYLLKEVHVFICLLVSLVLGVWYLLNRRKIDVNIFLMASFKIYLSFFLAFIQTPYEYLMIVGIFVSAALFTQQLRFRVSVAPHLNEGEPNKRHQQCD